MMMICSSKLIIEAREVPKESKGDRGRRLHKCNSSKNSNMMWTSLLALWTTGKWMTLTSAKETASTTGIPVSTKTTATSPQTKSWTLDREGLEARSKENKDEDTHVS